MGGWLTPRPAHFILSPPVPPGITQYPLYRRLEGPQDGCGKSLCRRNFVCLLYCVLYPYLCLCFACVFVLIGLHFDFCPYLQHTTQISVRPAGFELAVPASERPQIYALDRVNTGIRFPDCPARSVSLYRLGCVYVEHHIYIWWHLAVGFIVTCFGVSESDRKGRLCMK